jgi:hypothetical protein
MVMNQRPKDLDTAFVLSQMQEEIVEASRTWEYKKYDSSTLLGAFVLRRSSKT